ncbi:hypothetical protein FVER14953_21258 [Fusarium verticillioides]|nr:hypothetical protein FVER14953_21258 [Fusarium verticillioides]
MGIVIWVTSFCESLIDLATFGAFAPNDLLKFWWWPWRQTGNGMSARKLAVSYERGVVLDL